GQLAQATLNTVQRGGDELEVVQAAALDRLSRIGAQDFQRSLEESLEVAGCQALVSTAQAGVVSDQLELKGFAKDSAHATIPKQGGHVIGVRTHSQVLVINQIKGIV